MQNKQYISLVNNKYQTLIKFIEYEFLIKSIFFFNDDIEYIFLKHYIVNKKSEMGCVQSAGD